MSDTPDPAGGRNSCSPIQRNGHAGDCNGGVAGQHDAEDLFLQKYGLATTTCTTATADSNVRSITSSASSTTASGSSNGRGTAGPGSHGPSRNGAVVGSDCSVVADPCPGSESEKSVGATSPSQSVTGTKTSYVKHGHGSTKQHRDLPPTPNGTGSVKNGDSEKSTANPDLPPRQPVGGGTGTARYKANKSSSQVSSIPEEEITIPNDGNLASFSADSMATFLRCLRLEDRLVNHLHRNGLDGRKFGRLKDSDLDNLQLKNPVIVYFRDKTAPAVSKKPKQRLPFVL